MNTLLIVDDNPQNLYMLHVLLSSNGFEVEVASNGAEALERARRVPPDMIVSDILMPVMDGFSLCRAWKQDELLKKIPFVFYTATYTDPNDEAFALSLGADKFVVKPMEPDKLLELLRQTWKNFENARPEAPPPLIEESDYNQQYNAALIRKLEAKMLQLEEVNRALERDIAERLSLESQVRQSQKMEAIGRLAGGVAHDFNNLLMVVLCHAELGLGEVEKDHPLCRRLKAIMDVSKRSSAIVRQLLTFARKQAVAPEVLDLNRVVEGMIKVIERLIGEDISIVWLPNPDLWPVKIDPTQIEQILANLCVNARDAIKGVGSITIATGNASFDDTYCTHHAEFKPGDYAMLTVSDSGCGMEEETLGRIFEPFFTTKEVGLGTGLGLSTVYGIVKQNHGFVDVSSKIGEGTTFKIYLARHRGQAADAPTEDNRELPKSMGETVLVVEDETAVLELVRGILERLGYTVLTACAPAEAMRLVSEHAGEIDLLVTDVILPELTGKELAEQIRSKRPAMKCLFMSGYTQDVIAYRGMLEEGAQFIMKPFSMRGLANKVRAVLAADAPS